MRVFLCTVMMLVFLAGCTSHSSVDKRNILSADSMKVIMWDLIKADELFIRLSTRDSTLRIKKENIRYYEEVFALHKIRKGQFDTSYKYYEAHPVEMKAIIDSLQAFAEKEKNIAPKPGQAAQ